MTSRLDDPRTPLALLLAACLGALAAAFIGEYVFGLQPCILCLYERVPWAAAAAVCAVGLLIPARVWRLRALALCTAVFAAGAALAFYHVGVEAHWWASVAGCEGGAAGSLTLDDLRAEALAEPLKPCDQVDFRLFGLSLAGWNVVLSAGACLLGAFGISHLSGRKTA